MHFKKLTAVLCGIMTVPVLSITFLGVVGFQENYWGVVFGELYRSEIIALTIIAEEGIYLLATTSVATGMAAFAAITLWRTKEIESSPTEDTHRSTLRKTAAVAILTFAALLLVRNFAGILVGYWLTIQELETGSGKLWGFTATQQGVLKALTGVALAYLWALVGLATWPGGGASRAWLSSTKPLAIFSCLFLANLVLVLCQIRFVSKYRK